MLPRYSDTPLEFDIVIPLALFSSFLANKSILGPYGVVWTEGNLWKEQRRFALQVLRNFGLGKNIMQERVIFGERKRSENRKI